MIKLKQAIVVEGRYDKAKLASIFDTTIIQTDGFAIFRNPEKLELIRRLARQEGIIILTDSDKAGFKIRNYIGGAVQEAQIIHIYIPDIPGKERRKPHPSAEGKLGVEGVEDQLLIEAFRKAGVLDGQPPQPPARPITKLDLFEDGFTGGPQSRQLRAMLLQRLKLPEHLSTNALVSVLGRLLTYEQYRALADELKAELSDEQP